MKRFTKTMVGSLALALGMAMSMGQVVGAQTVSPADPASVALAFEKTIGVDVDAGLALVADDALLKITPAPQGTPGLWTGKDEIRQALQYSAVHLVKREAVGTPQVNGNNVTYNTMVSNDFFQRLGVAPVQFTTEVIVEGGKIKSFVTTIAPSEQGRVATAAKALQAASPAPAPAGMPRTGGNELTNTIPFALLIAVFLTMAGVAIRRSQAHARRRN
jgi:hypothetical protein